MTEPEPVRQAAKPLQKTPGCTTCSESLPTCLGQVVQPLHTQLSLEQATGCVQPAEWLLFNAFERRLENFSREGGERARRKPSPNHACLCSPSQVSMCSFKVSLWPLGLLWRYSNKYLEEAGNTSLSLPPPPSLVKNVWDKASAHQAAVRS